MTESHCGTIAQLLYAHKHQLDFAQVVGDLHALLVRFPDLQLIFEWDCDDIALFDLSSTRIALGWDTSPGKGYSACLTVSVGSATDTPSSSFSTGHQEMCSRLVERLHQEFPALTILWHQTSEALTADLIDRLVEELPPVMQLFPFEEPQWVGDTLARHQPRSPTAARETEAAAEHVTGHKNKRAASVDPKRKAREAVNHLQAIRVSACARAMPNRHARYSRQSDATAF